MAAKENQGLQAIVITLVVLLLIFVVLLVFVNNARKAAVARADNSAASEQSQRQAASSAQQEANIYKEAMGNAEGDSLEATQAAIAEDFEEFGADMPAEERNYSNLIETQSTERRRLASALNEASKREDELRKNLESVQVQANQQVEAYKQQLDEATAQFAAAKNEFENTEQKLQENNSKLASNFTELQNKHDQAVQQLNAQVTELTNTLSQLERSLDQVKSQVPDPDPFAEPADARITWVNQRYQKAWLDIGSADGLSPQVTFSVFSKDNSDAIDAEKKASIEVVRIWGPHLAEARITSSDLTDPIMPGDLAFSQVWDRGRTVGFAIAGYIDINNDGASDMDQLTDIIAASGGRVDVAPNEEGAKTGDMKVDTRFLILGERPTDPRHSGYLNSWDEISKSADLFGVPTIALADFLRLMGWKNDARSVKLGEGARGADFPPKQSDYEVKPPAKNPPTQQLFEPRVPTVPY